MSYGTQTFWDIYSFGLHPICGTAIVVIAFVIFMVGVRDDRKRRLFWVATILAGSLLGFFIGEWEQESWRVGVQEMSGADLSEVIEWRLVQPRARMMFLAQAALAVTFALGLLWWPIRSKED